MTDERNREFGGAPSRGPNQGAADRRDTGADALLELARLIGQSDPFAADGAKAAMGQASMPPPASMPPAVSPPAISPPGLPPAGMPDGRLGNMSRVATVQTTAAREAFVPPPPPDRSYDDRRREPGFESRAPVQQELPDAGGLGFLRRPDRDDYPVAPPHDDEPDYDGGARQMQTYGHDEGHPDEYHDDAYADAEYGEEPDDFDEDEHGGRRRWPGRMVMAVLGLAVFGGVAAFGYRTVFNTSPSGPTPVIRADNTPTKMTPMGETKPESGRLDDRVGERIVPRAEEPVDVRAGQGPQDTIGGVTPPGIMPGTVGAVVPPVDSKRVHTVAVSADSGTSSRNPSRGVQAQSQTQPASAAAPPTRQVAAVPPSPPPPAPPTRQAALAPAPADTGAASPSAPSDSGGYVVQLSAVRSEADAQAAFSRLQAKYPMLGGRQPLIRRKDQGDKGIFFAAQVGPFGIKNDADQLCDQLKSAGGSCYVLRN